MNIWLVSIAEQTPVDNAESTRFLNIAEAALSKNHHVTYFASTFKHNTKIQRFEETTEVDHDKNYKLVFLKSMAYKKNVSFQRLYSHYKFAKDLVNYFDKREKPDVIYLGFPPISLGFEVTKWAKKNGIPVIVDIIDPWPDMFKKELMFLPDSIQNGVLYPLSRRAKKTFQNTTGVAAISNQYIDWAKKYHANILYTECFYPAVNFQKMFDQIQELKAKQQKDHFKLRVIYAGSLASSYDIPTILKAAEILNKKYQNEIEFSIAGAGPQDEIIKKYESRLTNLKFLGRLTKPKLMEEYALCDLGTTQHIKGASQSVTYKLFDLLACQLPILNSLESEMKDIIVENKVGFHNDPGDFETLAKHIEHFHLNRDILEDFKKNATELTREQGDAPVVYDRLIQYIEKVSNQKLEWA